MKNQADYSLYKCPYSHIEKDCGHELKGPEGYKNTYGIWCACGFRGPVFTLDPHDLKLKKIGESDDCGGQAVNDTLKKAEELLDQMLSRAYYGSDEHEELLSLISQLVEENQKQKEVINKPVIWFNSVEEGFASDLRPDVARADFYRSLRANRPLTN